MALAVDSILFDELTTDPGSPVEGQQWYNTTTKLFKVYRNGAVSYFTDHESFTAHTTNTLNPHSTTLEQARTAGNVLAGTIAMGGFAITNLGAGSAGTDAAQRQWVIDQVNSKVAGLDWQESALSRLTTPPGSPVSGDRYLVTATATGVWAGKEDQVAHYDGAAWAYTVPTEGATIRVESENLIYTYDGVTWGNIGNAVQHGALLGLSGDDHTQYLLASGARAMAGNLDMGGNNITNINLVDGIDVTLHAARHAPGGADAIATAAAVGLDASTSNTTGTGTALARNDHSHALDTTNGTLSTVAADAVATNGTATGLARRDHVHAVSVGAAVAITSATNGAGVATTLARSDHSHAHGSLLGGTLHALVGTPANGHGFYPQSNFSAVVNPSVNNDGTAGYVPGSRWVNTTNASEWVCISNATGAAVWQNTLATASFLQSKSGRVMMATFAGTPKKATVTFSAAFADANYAVTVTPVITVSGTHYAPNVESQVAGSFVINMGTATISSLVQCNWTAVVNGESA